MKHNFTEKFCDGEKKLSLFFKKHFFHPSAVCAHPGIMIVGEETVGRYDLGIYVASIVPGGPADKDGRIRQGGESCGSYLLSTWQHCVQCVDEVFF